MNIGFKRRFGKKRSINKKNSQFLFFVFLLLVSAIVERTPNKSSILPYFYYIYSIHLSWSLMDICLWVTLKITFRTEPSLIPLLRVCGLCSECGDCPPEDIVPWRPFCPITGDSSLFFRVLERERRMPGKHSLELHLTSPSQPTKPFGMLQKNQTGMKSSCSDCHGGWAAAVAQTKSVFRRSRSSWKNPDINQVGLLDFSWL